MLFEYGASAKWLDLLKEIRRSHLKQAVVLRDRTNPAATAQFGATAERHGAASLLARADEVIE